MSLWLCLRFEQLPLECLDRSDELPVTVLERQRVLRTNDCAAALGIREGMSSATVRALAGDGPLRLLERDPAAERRCLQQLCCWAYGVTPSLHSWRQDCLQLEIGSCLNLYRGLDAVLAEVRSGVGSRQFRARLGLATTPAAAWLLSFAAPDAALAIDRPLEQRLAPLPLHLLEDFAPAVDSLRRAGIHRLGELLALPAAALGRRCGQPFHHFLQRVLGQRLEPQPDYRPPPDFSDEYWFGYGVQANEELLPAVQLLLQSLCRFLRNSQLQSSEICWQLVGLDGKLRPVTVRSSSSHSDWENWYQLTRLCFERLQLDSSVEGLALHCRELSPGQMESCDLFSSGRQREPLGNLLDRLRNRLGLQAIEQLGCRDEHLPEYALHISNDRPGNEAGGRHCAQRPFWLLPRPQALGRRGGQLHWNGTLALVYGPERIEDNWWREAVSRDYYIAEDRSGQHYWVFRDRLAQDWFIHGIFA